MSQFKKQLKRGYLEMPAAPDSTTKWNERLHKGHWFKRGSWYVIFYLGRGFSFGKWNPVKKYFLRESDSSKSVNRLSILRISGQTDLQRNQLLSRNSKSAFNQTKSKGLKIPRRLSANNMFSDTRDNPDLDSDFATALHHVAFGELDEAKKLLDKDARLVLQSGTVETRAGLTVKHKTLLECALGEGDHEMAAMIIPYFSQIQDGEEEKEKQLERYRPVIENLANQKPYNGLKKLFEIIKQSSFQDVKAALDKTLYKNENMDHPNALRDALIEFREAVTLKEVTQPQMHYNYQTFIQAVKLFELKWSSLNDEQRDLVWRQVIGYLQRGLPAIDRFAVAQGSKKQWSFTRTTKYTFNTSSFPDVSKGSSDFSGPGFDYGIFAGAVKCATMSGLIEATFLEDLWRRKNIQLAKLIPQLPKSETKVSVRMSR